MLKLCRCQFPEFVRKIAVTLFFFFWGGGGEGWGGGVKKNFLKKYIGFLN